MPWWCVAVFVVANHLAAAGAVNAQPTAWSENCADLPWTSYPPNQISRVEDVEGRVASVIDATRPNTLGEFFVEVDSPGTYRVSVSALRAPNGGVFQLQVDGEPLGAPVDLLSTAREWSEFELGDLTFLRPGTRGLRFAIGGTKRVTESMVVLGRITLTPVSGFTLLSPNGSCESELRALLRWNPWPGTKSYIVELDDAAIGQVAGDRTAFRTNALIAGSHRWRVIAVEASGRRKTSNVFTFCTGSPALYPERDFVERFDGRAAARWELTGMSVVAGKGDGDRELMGSGSAAACASDVAIGKGEGEFGASVRLSDAKASAGVGFRADDGTLLYAVVDAARGEFRLERRSRDYSIFDVTPKRYWVEGWHERREAGSHVWEIAAAPTAVVPEVEYRVSFAFSRRSSCAMAIMRPPNGDPIVLRDLSDTRTPDHPVVLSAGGAVRFGRLSYRRLNQQVYKWDPDSVRIVLRPGRPTEWDAKGAFNPAVFLRDGKWCMIYRGNAVPAPPGAKPASALGLATSTDGVHWVKYAGNPIIPREGPGDSKEDPDVIIPEGSRTCYLEYRNHIPFDGEVIGQSEDLIHWRDWGHLPQVDRFLKYGALVDGRKTPSHPDIADAGKAYRFFSIIEEGRIMLSNDLYHWVTPGVAPLGGKTDAWCNDHECAGDAFVDHDGNFRVESQAGVIAPRRDGSSIVGNRLCTIVEEVLDGADPTRVRWRSELPWLPDWYGDAPTGDLNDFTATNGSVFPGQTVVKDGYLWHYSGGNNTFTLLCKCRYSPEFLYRDLMVRAAASGGFIAEVTVRNVGSLGGGEDVAALVDGSPAATTPITLERDEEKTFSVPLTLTPGLHTIAIADASASVEVR